MKLIISAAFDAGNIEVVAADHPENIQLKIEKDSHSEFLQWFYFRMQGAKGKACKLHILNAGEAGYPEGWDNYQARASYDRHTWFQVPSSYKDGVLSMDFTFISFLNPLPWVNCGNHFLSYREM